MIWVEASAITGVKVANRLSLVPAGELVIWTAPPSPHILRQAVKTVDPHTIALFAIDPGLDRFQPFITRLAGLAKHTLNKYSGAADLEALAAAMAHRPETVLGGLECLAGQGLIYYTKLSKHSLQLHPGDGQPKSELPALIRQLKHQLAETAAFRNYLRWADASQIAIYLNPIAASDQEEE